MPTRKFVSKKKKGQKGPKQHKGRKRVFFSPLCRLGPFCPLSPFCRFCRLSTKSTLFTGALKTRGVKFKAAQSAALHGAHKLAHERACELLGVRRSAPP